MSPEYTIVYYYRAKVYANVGKVREALNDFTQAIVSNPKEAVFFFDRGTLYFRLRDFRRTLADAHESVRLDPSSYRHYILRALAYLYLGEYERAAADFSEGIDDDPSNAYYGLAAVHSTRYENVADESDLTKALNYIEKAIQAGFKDWDRLSQDPRVNSLRADARFGALIKRQFNY